MAYKVIILYQLYMPSYFLGTFTEYPYVCVDRYVYTCRPMPTCTFKNKQPVLNDAKRP